MAHAEWGGGMRETEPRNAGKQAAERGSYVGWTLAAVFMHVAVLLWARWVKPPVPGAIDEWSPVGTGAHKEFADAYGETARKLRVRSAKLGMLLSLLLQGSVGFLAFYEDIRAWTALAAERRVASFVEEALLEPGLSARVVTRVDWGPWPAGGAWAGTYRSPGRFEPLKAVQVSFGDSVEIRWSDDGCGGTLEPVGRPGGGSREYVARVTWGVRKCVDDGTVVLTRTGPATMDYTWHHPSSRHRDRGTLEASFSPPAE